MTEPQPTQQQRFCALLEPNHDRLARFARAMTKTREDAQDLVADTIEQAYKHFGSLKNDEAFLSWLFTIARRIQNRRRWRMSIFDRFSPEGYGAFHEDRSQSSPETQADTQILYDALQRLPHKQREAFVLFEISGFSLQEIQEMQGDSLSAVKMRLVRARETLRTMLQDRFGQDTATAPVHKASIHHLSNPSSSEQNAIRQANISPLRRST